MNFASYLCELTIVDPKMYKFRPSLIATASVYLAKKILRRRMPYSPELRQHTGYKESEVKECCRQICLHLHAVPNKPESYKSIFEKYSGYKRERVAGIPE